MKSFFVSIISTLLLATSQACTDSQGNRLKHAFSYPPFETSAAGVQTTYNETIAVAETALQELLALTDLQDDSVSVTKLLNNTAILYTFDNTLGALHRLEDDFWAAGYRLYFLSKVSDDEEIRLASQQAAMDLEKWSRDNLSYNLELFELLAAFNRTLEASALKGEPKRLLEETLKGYERRGMGLSEEDRATLSEWQDRLSELTTNISANIVADTGLVEFDLDQLEGLSEDQLATLPYDESTDKYGVLTSIASQYVTVATYASSPETRLEILVARLQRAMESNGPLILEVLQLRQQVASLLGFDNWADLKTADRMAGTGETAYDFINNLDTKLQDKFDQEQSLLLNTKRQQLAATDEFATTTLNQEDVSYYRDIVLKNDYQVDQVEVSHYFEESATLRGMFAIYEKLFGITITQRDQEVPGGKWADDVQYYEIAEASDGSPLGGMYLDLHPREGKFNHFAKFSLIKGGQITLEDGTTVYRAPLGAIIGNWPEPSQVGNSTVSLWRFSQVNTAFHELGHLLHEVFTCAEFGSFAGTAVPRDFVEAPSQMLERWLEDSNVIRSFAKHYETGEDMPESLLQSLIDSKNVFVGHYYKRQVSLGKSDLRIHSYESQDEIPSTYLEVYADTNEDYSAYYPAPEDTAGLASFGHLFGGYDAGYYGYAWADAIAADLASPFRQSPDGFMDATLGAKFRTEILEPGNSRDINDSMKAFLGREWNTDAFFEEMGLSSEPTSTSTTSTTSGSTTPEIDSDPDELDMTSDTDSGSDTTFEHDSTEVARDGSGEVNKGTPDEATSGGLTARRSLQVGLATVFSLVWLLL